MLNTISRMANGTMGLFFKFFLMLILFVFILAAVVALAVYWPFTMSLAVCIFLSEMFYREMSKRLNIALPEYFFVNINDFIATFREGDDEFAAFCEDLREKKGKALNQLEELREATRSADEQLSQIKVKRSLGTLLKRQPADISQRAAKALEMELGKPRWARYIDQLGDRSDGEWDQLMV